MSKSNVKPQKRSKKSALIVLVLLVAGGLGAAKFAAGGNGSTSSPIGPQSGVTTSPVEMHGESETLQPTLLNLADGRLLRIGVSIETRYRVSTVSTAAPEASVEGEAASSKLLQISDAVIRVMGAYSSADLLRPAGREGAKVELRKAFEPILPGEIKGIYFYDFVVQ